MRSLAGITLQILGWALAAWSSIAGIGFIGVLMINFVGTHGAESGRDILVILGLGTAGILLGVAIAKLGKHLSTKNKTGLPPTRG